MDTASTRPSRVTLARPTRLSMAASAIMAVFTKHSLEKAATRRGRNGRKLFLASFIHPDDAAYWARMRQIRKATRAEQARRRASNLGVPKHLQYTTKPKRIRRAMRAIAAAQAKARMAGPLMCGIEALCEA
jgi:hypothetical protein